MAYHGCTDLLNMGFCDFRKKVILETRWQNVSVRNIMIRNISSIKKDYGGSLPCCDLKCPRQGRNEVKGYVLGSCLCLRYQSFFGVKPFTDKRYVFHDAGASVTEQHQV